MEDCCNCLSLKKQLDDVKQKHLLDFRTIKQKIISTDTLIKSFQEKCQEYDKQKKYVVELTSKLDGSQRSVEVIKLQLKKSLELNEPLHKKCNELERENAIQSSEIQLLRDRARGSEILVSQLQSVVKECEESKNSLALDASLHNVRLEEYEKRKKKNEAQISKLSEQVQKRTNKNKELNKELTKSQNQVKTLLYEREESRKLVSHLEKQLNAGNGQCVQQNDATLQRQISTLKTEAEEYQKTIRDLKEDIRKGKQRSLDENKIPVEIESPTTPLRKSSRTRKIITPLQRKESVAERIPLNSLQQKNFVEEIEKKSLQVKRSKRIPFSHQESPTSESESDAEQTGRLLDKVDEIFGMPYCPSLSPLPPSQFGDDSDKDSTSGDSSDDDVDDGDNDVPINDDVIDLDDGNDDVIKSEHIKKDDLNNILQTEDSESRGKKREHTESTCLDFGGTITTQRSRKKRKSGTTSIGFGLLSKETDKVELSETRPQIVRRTRSTATKEEFNSSDVNGSVTRSKSLEKTTGAVLEVKRKRRRTKMRLSSDHENSDHEKSFEISGLVNVDNNVFESSKLPTDIASLESCVYKKSEGRLTEESGKKTNEIDTCEAIPKRSMIECMTKLDKQEIVSEGPSSISEASTCAATTLSKDTNNLTTIQDNDSISESDKKSQTGSKDRIEQHIVAAKADNSEDERSIVDKIYVTENQREIEILTHTDTIVRPETRSIVELWKQGVVPEAEKSSTEDSSVVEVTQTQNKTNIETVVNNHVSSNNKCNYNVPVFQESVRNCTETDKVLQCLGEIVDNVVNAASGTCERVPLIHARENRIDTESDTDTGDVQLKVKECLNAGADSIYNESKLSAQYNSTGTKERNEFQSTSKSEAIDICDNHVSWDVYNDVLIKKMSAPNMDNIGMKRADKIRLGRTLNREKDTISGGVSASYGIEEANEDIRRNNFNKSSFDGCQFKLLDQSQTAKTSETQYETDKELALISLSKKSRENVPSIQQIGAGFYDPTIIHGTTSTTPSPLPDSMTYFEGRSEQTCPPLSPIPVSPEKRCLSKEIPSFDSLDYFCLSPIPPSPCPIRTDEDETFTSSNLTFDEILERYTKESQPRKKIKLNRNELPNDSLLRYPGVKRLQFAVYILTKLKNKEISLGQLITAFSNRRNIKNHTHICTGLVEVLKLTQDDEEHALMKKYVEQYESGPECTNEPIVSEFEGQMLAAFHQLSNIQRFSNLMTKLINWFGLNISRLFKSGTNDAVLLAMCRIYTGVCRLIGKGSCVRVLCYDILKQNERYSATERIVFAVALVWPEVLGRSIEFLNTKPDAVTITGTAYHPFLATLQVILLSREMSCEHTREGIKRLCGWTDVATDENVVELLARDLLHVLRVTCTATSEENREHTGNIGNVLFEINKCFELVAVIMGWKWTNDILIRDILWSVLKEWKMKGIQSKPQITSDGDKSVRTSNEAVCLDSLDTKDKLKSDGNMEDTIANILCLLGVLVSEGLQKEETVNVNAIIRLMCAIVTPDCERVSLSVQVSAASALLDMISADPVNITQVLNDWSARCSIENETLIAQFKRRMTEVRTREWIM